MAHGARGRGHGSERQENHERWLLTYADLITLLMVFFVVLYSMSQSDSAKFRRISAALERAFNIDVLQGQTSKGINDGTAESISPVEELFTTPEHSAEVARLKSKIEEVLTGSTQAPSVSVGSDKEGVVIRLSGSYLFDSGRAELKPNSLAVLDAVASEIRLLPNDVRVDGHTDATPIDSARYPTNWELSAARALAVTRYLSEVDGVASGRLTAAGYGEFHPLAPNDTREHRAQNRRVEIHILSSQSQASAAEHPES
jgi:chemotaxis protein MotB